MAKLHTETLLGMGFLDANGEATPSNPPPSNPPPSLVDAHRGQGPVNGESVDEATHAATTETANNEPQLGATTQPGLGVSAHTLVYGSSSAERSGPHVRVSTQNGSSVRPAPSPTSNRTGRTTPLPSGVVVDTDVYTSAPLGTLPFDTRLPKTLNTTPRRPSQVSHFPLDTPDSSPSRASRAASAQPARPRGFATIPPVTPKVLTREDGWIAAAARAPIANDPVASGGNAAPSPFPPPKFAQTLFGNPSPLLAAPGASSPPDALDATPSPITPRAKRPLATASSLLTTDAPRAPSSTLDSARNGGHVTPSAQPITVLRPTEETFRPSAHTTPPGLPEPSKGRRSWWALAALPVAAGVTLASYKLEATSVVHGAVVLEGGMTPVVSQVSGPIIQVLVKPGDTVVAGQAVAEVDPSSLEHRRDELRARQIALLDEQERVATLGAKWHSAATDALQRKRSLLWQRLRLRSEGASNAAAKEGSNADRDAVLLIRQELADVEFELNRRESDRDDQQRTWQHRMNEVHTALSQLDDTSTSVRAPVAGRVEVLLAAPGQVLPAGSPVAQLVPDSAATQLVVLVPTALAAKLDVGSALTVTLPLAEDTTLPARVTRVADGNVTREEAASLLSAPQLEPLVRVEVELAAPEAAPKLRSLRPGQRFSASVPDEERSLWRHLVSKFQ